MRILTLHAYERGLGEEFRQLGKRRKGVDKKDDFARILFLLTSISLSPNFHVLNCLTADMTQDFSSSALNHLRHTYSHENLQKTLSMTPAFLSHAMTKTLLRFQQFEQI